MPSFLYTGRNKDGTSVTERIDAPSVSAARYKLELNGYTDLNFHVDDLGAQIDGALFKEFPEVDMTVLTPEQERDARRGGGVLNEIWRAWCLNTILWVPLLIANLISLYQGRPFGWFDYSGFALSALFLVYFVWLVIPGVAYQRLLETGVNYQFEQSRQWASLIRLWKRIALVPIADFELDFRVGFGLAAEGKLDQAIELTKKYESHSCGKFLFYSRLSGLYEAAGDYPKMTEARRLAVQHGTGKPEEKLDLALGLLRRERKTAEAKQIMEEVDLSNCGDIVAMFHEYCRGLLAVELNQWREAEQHLRQTMALAKPYENNPLTAGMLKDIAAYLSLALSHLGNFNEAKMLLHGAEPLLRARRENELINRCRAALGQPGIARPTMKEPRSA